MAKVVEKKASSLQKKQEEPAAIKTLGEAGIYNRLIASHILKAQRIELALAHKIEKFKAEASAEVSAEIARHKKQAAELAKAVYAFAEEHRAELTEDEKLKTIETPDAGGFRWYDTPSSLVVEDEEATIRTLEGLGLGRYVRIIKEIDKEALEKDPAVIRTLSGVHVEPGKEKFLLSPPIAPPAVQTKMERAVSGRDVWRFVTPPKKEKAP